MFSIWSDRFHDDIFIFFYFLKSMYVSFCGYTHMNAVVTESRRVSHSWPCCYRQLWVCQELNFWNWAAHAHNPGVISSSMKIFSFVCMTTCIFFKVSLSPKKFSSFQIISSSIYDTLTNFWLQLCRIVCC